MSSRLSFNCLLMPRLRLTRPFTTDRTSPKEQVSFAHPQPTPAKDAASPRSAAKSYTGQATAAGLSIKKIPGPISLPLIGSLWRYKLGIYGYGDWHKSVFDLFKQYGPIVQEKLGAKRIVHVYDPDDIQYLYSLEGKTPVMPPLQPTVEEFRADNDISLGLGNTNGEEWYRLRSAIQKLVVRPRNASAFMSVTNPIACEFVERIARKRDPETHMLSRFNREIARWSLESAVNAITEVRLNALSDSADDHGHRVQRMLDANEMSFRLSGMLKLSLPIYRYGLKTSKWRQLSEAENFFYQNIVSVTEGALIQLEALMKQHDAPKLDENPIEQLEIDLQQRHFNESDPRGYQPYLFLRTLLQRDNLSRKDVHVLVLSFISDGLKTTVPQVIFNVHNLACSPEAQHRLNEEVNVVLGNVPDDALTLDLFEKMPYLRACIRETFRLQPTNLEVSRYIQQDVVLRGYRIPAGTYVDLNAFVHFRDPKLFPEPNKFLPERWLKDREMSQIHPYLKQPFGHGPRMCAGRRLAEQDLYTILSLIVKLFRLEIVDESGDALPGRTPDDLPVQCYVLPTPACDPQIAFHDR